MSQNYITDPTTGNGYTNLINPQVYDKAKGLACGWKWMCQDPCCGESPWPKGRCSCCDECELGPDADEDNVGEGEYSDEPCCYNGTCCPCKNVAGDAPTLTPEAIGCGRRHICKILKTLPLCREQLDTGVANGGYADLPGRPPHTIVCVRATGASVVQNENCFPTASGGTRLSDLNLINPNCDSYNLWVRFKIPVEVIVRDCSGYLYCLKSFFTERVRIPLTSRIHNLGPSYIYAKVRVRLCYPNKAEAVPLYNGGTALGKGPTTPTCTFTCTGPTFPFNCIDAIAADYFRRENQHTLAECLMREDEAKGCHYEYTFGTYRCVDRDNPNGPNLRERCANGNPKLDILIEACVVRFVPSDNTGNGSSPYVCVPSGHN